MADVGRRGTAADARRASCDWDSFMPTYEYECGKCGHTFDLFQSMTDKRRTRCPKCRGAIKRLLGTGAGIIFKGSGFYQTDYRSAGYKQQAKGDSAASSVPKAEKPGSDVGKKSSDSGSKAKS